jgi:hypothetical protein
MSIDEAYNYRAVNERVATSGQVETGVWSRAEADEFMWSIWQPDEHDPWPRWLEEVS